MTGIVFLSVVAVISIAGIFSFHNYECREEQWWYGASWFILLGALLAIAREALGK